MFTFLVVTWVVGMVLILGVAVQTVASNQQLDEGLKVIAITLCTILWPLALVYGCLVSWKRIMVGK